MLVACDGTELGSWLLEAELDMEAIIGLSFGPVRDVMLVSTVDLRLAVSGNEDWIEICFNRWDLLRGNPHFRFGRRSLS